MESITMDTMKEKEVAVNKAIRERINGFHHIMKRWVQLV